MEEAPSAPPSRDLAVAAARAKAAFDWPKVPSLYTQALERTPTEERENAFALLEGRVECYRLALARDRGDSTLEADSLASGDRAPAEEALERRAAPPPGSGPSSGRGMDVLPAG